MGCINAKKTLVWSMKWSLPLFVLCVLPLCVFNGWLRGFQFPVGPENPPDAAALPSWNSSGGGFMTVLLWHWPFGASSSLTGADECWDLYRVPNCRLVDRRDFLPSADVVVFHNRELIEGRQKLPLDRPRPAGQRWAWMSLESPANNGNLRQFANIFNLTLSYRRDADVTIPYGELVPKEPGEDPGEDVPKDKTTLVCWVVSNYRSEYRRSKVYKELQAEVPVKVFGAWSGTPLKSDQLLPTISRCYFYLAFENSISRDYITEKLWKNAYLGGAVPVVLGASLDEYKAVAPPNSFIHVDQFPSVRDLGKYLRQLAEDKRRYREYFEWKKQWKVKVYWDWKERLCQICSENVTLPRHKVYRDLQAWVNG